MKTDTNVNECSITVEQVFSLGEPMSIDRVTSKNIAPRKWLYGSWLCRGHVSALVAPAGRGKSSLIIAEALAMASGTPLLGEKTIGGRLSVALWNGEESRDEMDRRIAAAMQAHHIGFEEIEGRIRAITGHAMPIKIVTAADGALKVDEALVCAIIDELVVTETDVLVLDPFVSTHEANENDNRAIDLVSKTLARIAVEANCAVVVVHHARKQSNGAKADIGVDDARGASALIATVRSARVINSMSKDEAALYGIEEMDRWKYFRVDDGKGNMAPASKARWHVIESVTLDNATPEYPAGDSVGVVKSWKPASLFADLPSDCIERAKAIVAAAERPAISNKSQSWIGFNIAAEFGFETETVAGKRKIDAIVKAWLRNGVFAKGSVKDTRTGREIPILTVPPQSSALTVVSGVEQDRKTPFKDAA